MSRPERAAPIRVLLVEDTPAMRELLTYVVNSDPALQVIAVAEDGEQAVLMAERLHPDVILMDIHLPGMNGFTATRKIMEICPTRIVMVTATSIPGEVEATFQAMESGALTVLGKPAGIGHPEHRRLADELVRTLKLMSEVKVVKRWARVQSPPRSQGAAQQAAVEPRASIRAIGIGASTGGPLAVREVLSGLAQPLAAPILIVQHISSGFTEGFVDWLGKASGYAVRLAAHGEKAQGGVAYVAPDGWHLTMTADCRLILRQGPLEHGMRPSVSVLFRALAENFGADAIGILLTGMGADGAEELGNMRRAGATTIAQDRESSVVHGMPGEALRLNAATHVLPPERIGPVVAQLVLRARSIDDA